MRILRKDTTKWYTEVLEYLSRLKLGIHNPEKPYNLNFTPRRLIKQVIRIGVFKAPYPFKWMNAKIVYNPSLPPYSDTRIFISLVLINSAEMRYYVKGNTTFWYTIISFRVLYKLAKMIMENNRPINATEMSGYWDRLRDYPDLLNVNESYVSYHFPGKVYHNNHPHYGQTRILLSLAYSVIYLAYDEKTCKYTIRDYGVVTCNSNIIAVADEHWCVHNSIL